MVKNILFVLLFVVAVVGCSDDNTYHTIIKDIPNIPGYTYIPDNRFEQALVDLGVDKTDTILDNMVKTEHIENIRELHVDSLDIYELTGIQDFVSLEVLYCDWNNITELDLSENQALIKLDCKRNLIRKLNVKNCPSLDYLDCRVNELFGLDQSGNIGLETLHCQVNNLSSLNVSQNKSLKLLDCSANQIFSLKLNNPKLQYLNCEENELTTLDLSKCSNLNQVQCSMNYISTTQFSENNNIIRLLAAYNKMQSIDLSICSQLTYLDLSDNELGTIKIRNGNNHGVAWFHLIRNPDLKCVEVDDADWATANWTYIDDTSVYSEDCDL